MSKNQTRFQIAVTAALDDGTEECIVGAIDPFDPETFKKHLMGCELDLAHSTRMIGEVSRKLTIEIEFASDDDLSDRVRDVHNALRDRCFKYEFQEPTVVHAEIQYPRVGSFDRAKVFCIFSNGIQKVVFDFYSDELSFNETEFHGKTEHECHQLFTKKDVAYLQS
jgi:hypothetical protein